MSFISCEIDCELHIKNGGMCDPCHYCKNPWGISCRDCIPPDCVVDCVGGSEGIQCQCVFCRVATDCKYFIEVDDDNN